MSLVGGAEVNALPDSPIEASLKIEFSNTDSYYAKAAQASVLLRDAAGAVKRLFPEVSRTAAH